jgi:hypothetical protein
VALNVANADDFWPLLLGICFPSGAADSAPRKLTAITPKAAEATRASIPDRETHL